MPLYEFRCAECGAEFEKLVRRAGAYDNVACPVCESRSVEEMLSTFASPAKAGSSKVSSSGCRPSGGG
jgi:putative FmdB family regulatory protein